MRVITGIYKGRRFDIPHNFKARPTTDFAKENLFNVLRRYTDFKDARALDLFSGTGSISIEFLSRGCSRVVLVEKDSMHFAFICNIIKTLNDSHAVPLHTDVLRFVPRCRESFDLVFADPPYALPELSQLPFLVMESNILTDKGVFILEHGKNNDFSNYPDFVEHRAYGSVNFSFFRKNSKND